MHPSTSQSQFAQACQHGLPNGTGATVPTREPLSIFSSSVLSASNFCLFLPAIAQRYLPCDDSRQSQLIPHRQMQPPACQLNLSLTRWQANRDPYVRECISLSRCVDQDGWPRYQVQHENSPLIFVSSRGRRLLGLFSDAKKRRVPTYPHLRHERIRSIWAE